MNLLEVEGESSFEIIINKSKFFGFCAFAENEESAIEYLNAVRKNHRTANHNCYAYSIGCNRGIMRYSDDGEPQGTAGVPILEVIKNMELTNVCVVVTRYFGGVLLGAGGLVRAYTKASAGALNLIQKVRMVKKVMMSAEIDYPAWAKLENILKNNAVLEKISYTDNILIDLSVLPQNLDNVIKNIYECSNGRAVVLNNGEKFIKERIEI